MGFFQKLFGKKQFGDATVLVAESPDATSADAGDGDADISVALEPALAAFQAGDYPSALMAARPYADDPDEGEDANRLCALSLSSLDRYPEAFDYWLALFEREPSANNALQLATCSVACGEVDRGEAWLVKFCQLNEEAREMQSVPGLVNFISALTQYGKPERAIPHLVDLKDVYAGIGSTDSTILYMHGVPFFSEFLQRSLPILQSAMDPEAIRSWYASLEGKLDEAGQSALDEWLGALPMGTAP